MAKFPIEETVPYQFPGLRVLAVDDDPTILGFIKQMCFRCHYQVITFSHAPLALNHVLENKGCIDMILIEVHMPIMDGYEFLQYVTKEINVPVIMMSIDDATSAVMKAVKQGACDYWIKPLYEDQFKIMWKHVARKAISENKLPKKDDFECCASGIDATVRNQKKSFNSEEFDVDEPDDCYVPLTKKPRVVWSEELHHQFVKAVMQIGLDKAQPKRILEVMNIPGLTREHVASHLQKYRLQLKRSNGVTRQPNEMPLPNTIYMEYDPCLI